MGNKLLGTPISKLRQEVNNLVKVDTPESKAELLAFSEALEEIDKVKRMKYLSEATTEELVNCLEHISQLEYAKDLIQYKIDKHYKQQLKVVWVVIDRDGEESYFKDEDGAIAHFKTIINTVKGIQKRHFLENEWNETFG